MNGWEAAYLLPGLWFAVLVAALGWALRRWWDALPWRAWAAFALVVAILFGPMLVAGGVQLPLEMLRQMAPWKRLEPSPWPVNRLQWDQLVEMTPWQAAVRRALGGGEWPLWNRFSETGMPLLADPQSQVLQPLVVATYPLSLPAAVGVTKALRVWLALVFAFLFLRRQGAGEVAALAGALAYGLSGFVLIWLGWVHATVAALLAALLYALAVSADRGARRDFLLVGATSFALLVAGHPETVLYSVGIAGAFAVARLIGRGGGIGGRDPEEKAAKTVDTAAPAALLRRRGALAARWALAGAIALAAAAPAILVTLEYAPRTMRMHYAKSREDFLARFDPFAAWRTAAGRQERLSELARRLLPIAAPNAYGNSHFGAYWGDMNSNEDATGFTGTAALLAALLAFVPLGRGVRRLGGERLVAALGVAALLLVAKTPGLLEWVMKTPLGDVSSAWLHRLLLVVTFAIAFLAAASWERWWRGELPRWAPAAVAVPLGALIAWAYLAQPGGREPPEPGALAELRTASMWVQLGVLAAAAALLSLRPGRRGGRGRAGGRGGDRPLRRGWVGGLAAAGLALVVAGELLFFHLPVNPPAPRRLFYPSTPPIEYLQRHAVGQRVVASRFNLLPNSATVFALSDLRASSPLKPFLVQRLLSAVRSEPEGFVDFLVRLERPALDLFGVRFALTDRGERLKPPWRRVFSRPEGWVWERPGALPLLFLPAAAEPIGADWVARVAAIEDYRARALIAPHGPSGEPPPGPERWSAADPGGSALSDLEIGSHRMRARALIAEPRLLATSIFHDGGWRLLAGGERLPTLWVNGPLLGAWLPPGAYRVELLYRPAGFVWGCLLAALGLAAGAAWWAGPVGGPGRRPGRRPAAAIGDR